MIAAERGDAKMVRFLLGNGADASATNLAGDSVWKIAGENNHREVALLLLDPVQRP